MVVVIPGTILMGWWIVLVLLLVNILMAAVVLPLAASVINRLSSNGALLAVDICVEG